MRIFVDTSAFFALADKNDRNHLAARAHFRPTGQRHDWLTTDHVIVETWLLLRSRLGFAAAQRFWDALGAGVATLVGVSSVDFERARRISFEWTDQRFSLVDCTSFAVIERLGLERALAFDAHFRVFRFGPGKRRRLKLLGD